jgi:hypothetical protein
MRGGLGARCIGVQFISTLLFETRSRLEQCFP